MNDAQLRELRERQARGEISTRGLKMEILSACDLAKPDLWETFGEELLLVRNEGLRAHAMVVIGRLPNYFWHVPASILGFHSLPSDNAMGGLVRHTKKVARMAKSMGDPWSLEHLSDSLVAAAFIHDGLKYGWDGGIPSEDDHASFAAKWLRSENFFAARPQIVGMIGAHHGKWGKWKPRTEAELAFHLADYVVSRGAVSSANGRK